MITSIGERIPLSDGNHMPGYGFGCYKAEGEELLTALAAAWQAGYRLYDTAAFYGNERTVGQALNPYNSEEYFIISKIWPTAFDNPVKALDQSLKELGAEYLDGYLIHWPGLDSALMLSVYEKLLREKEKGKIHSLGVSNFLRRHLEQIKTEFGHYPPINQIEVHPWYQEKDLCEFCAKEQIVVMAWSPLGRGNELLDPEILKIAKQTRKTVAQVILRWHIQENRVPIPKSVHAQRIIENAQVFEFGLSEEQMKILNGLDRPDGRRGPNPDTFGG